MWALPELSLRVPLQLWRVEFFNFLAAAAGALCKEQRAATRWLPFVDRAGAEAFGLPMGTS